MRVCKNCNNIIPWRFIDENGKVFSLRQRKYCLICNPIGHRLFWGDKKVNNNKDYRCSQVCKVCVLCKKEFSTNNRFTKCSACRSVERREKIKDISLIKQGGKCLLCGYNKCKKALVFHHIDPSTKKFNISHFWTLNKKELDLELEKCVLLCSNCHAEVHSGIVDIKKIKK